MASNYHIEQVEECRSILAYPSKLSSPTVIEDEVYCVAENGDILKVNSKGETEVVFTILGQPSSLTIKNDDSTFLISDFAHQTVFSREESNNYQIHNLVMEYNDHAFLGPHSLKVGPFTSSTQSIQRTSTLRTLGRSRRVRLRAP